MALSWRDAKMLFKICLFLVIQTIFCVEPTTLPTPTSTTGDINGTTTENIFSLDDLNNTVVKTNSTNLKLPTPCVTPNNENAYCIKVIDCPVLMKEIENKQAKEFLLQSQCEALYENRFNPKVCCGTLGNYRHKPTTQPTLTTTTSDINGTTTEDIFSLVDLNNTVVETNSTNLKFPTPCVTPNNENAYCMQITTCPVLMREIENKQAREFLLQSQCGPINENRWNPKVCCGTLGNYKHIRSKNPLPSSCGKQNVTMKSRIFGGQNASLGEFPWMAKIYHKSVHGMRTAGCGGFLIHSKFIVTAAHCTQASFLRTVGQIFEVHLGEHDTETVIDCDSKRIQCAEPVQKIRVVDVITHPKYDPKSAHHQNDIALIYLKKGARMSNYVQPICIIPNEIETLDEYWVSGWGKTEKKESSTVKMKVSLPTYNIQACADRFSLINIHISPNSQVCAGGERNKDSCTGDSGGPLMVPVNGTKWYAAGLVSYGLSCGKDWPGVYTNVSHYYPWIRKQIIEKTLIQSKNPKPHKHGKKDGQVH